MKYLYIVSLGFAATLFSGCVANHNLYYWGSYEDQIHNSYDSSGKFSPESRVIQFEAEAEKAKSKGQSLPPGFHAQLGYDYAVTDRKDLALEQFTMEKELFPESSVYMDLLINQIKPKKIVAQTNSEKPKKQG